MASHSSGKGAAWKRAERCRNHSDARSSPSAPSPSGRDIMRSAKIPRRSTAQSGAVAGRRITQATVRPKRRSGATSAPPGPSGISAASTATIPRPTKIAFSRKGGTERAALIPPPPPWPPRAPRSRPRGKGRADQLHRAVDLGEGGRAHHPDEVEPPVVRRQQHALPPVGAGRHPPDQDVRRVEPAVARAHHPVAGIELVDLVDELERRGGGVVAGHDRPLPRGADHRRHPARGVGQEDDPRRPLADAGDPPDEPRPVERRRSVGDAVDAADVDRGRPPERAA